ncbi:MAG: V-type ATP synthase subunit D [Candidatus Woesearchaeota archaeon]
MSQNIKPTRSELINLKRKIKLAQSGYNLLKKKRDGLIMEFFEILKETKTLRHELVEEYRNAVYKMNIARAAESDLHIKSTALAIAQKPEIMVETRNLMGVVVPKISRDSDIKKQFAHRGYGIISGSSRIDEAAHSFEIVVEKAIKVAEAEISMKKLLIEIEKTKRRVNGLEFEIIPRMTRLKNFITLRLEEMERENTFRMKRIKGKEDRE